MNDLIEEAVIQRRTAVARLDCIIERLTTEPGPASVYSASRVLLDLQAIANKLGDIEHNLGAVVS